MLQTHTAESVFNPFLYPSDLTQLLELIVPCSTVWAYITPGSMGVKNGVLNPFCRFLHLLWGFRALLECSSTSWWSSSWGLLQVRCDKEGHLKATAVSSVSINLSFYKCCVCLEGRLYLLFDMWSSSFPPLPPLLAYVCDQRSSRHPQNQQQPSHLAAPSLTPQPASLPTPTYQYLLHLPLCHFTCQSFSPSTHPPFISISLYLHW